MKALLADIELDVQELKCIIDALSREKTAVLCNVAKRNIHRMYQELDQLMNEINVISSDVSAGDVTFSANECLNNIDVEAEKTEEQDQSFSHANLTIEKENNQPILIETVKESEVPVVSPLSSTEKVVEEIKRNNSLDADCVSPQEKRSTIIENNETDKSDDCVPILADKLKPSDDLKRSISLNDSFRFSRELFDGNSERMNKVLQQVGNMKSLNAALAFLEAEINKPEDDETMVDLQEIVKKYFL